MLGVLCWLHARRVGVALSLLGATLGLIAITLDSIQGISGGCQP